MNLELKEKFLQANAILSEADNILLVSHENPDPDAVASILALTLVFSAQGKRVLPYLPTPPVGTLSFLKGFPRIQTMLPPDAVFDVALCLDYGDFFRLRFPSHFVIPAIITIDHHPFSTQQGDVVIVDPAYSSTCEILYWWLRETKFPLDKEIANCLLCGIIADTGGFLHISTSQNTFRATADLLSSGADIAEIFSRLTIACDISSARVLGRVFSKITVDEKTQLAYSWVTREELLQYESGNFYLQDIPSMIACSSPSYFGAFFIEEDDGYTRGSLRAESFSGRAVDFIARGLGGGGHRYAAGFRYQGSIQEALKKVLELAV